MTRFFVPSVHAVVTAAKFGVFAYLIYAALTAIIITASAGETVVLGAIVAGVDFRIAIGGIAGETDYGWFLRIATFANRLLFLYAFYRLWRLFGAFARKAYFSSNAIGHLRAFTGLFTLFTFSRIGIEFAHFALSAGAGSDRPDISDLGDLGYPILFFIIAHILNEARRNEEELESYF